MAGTEISSASAVAPNVGGQGGSAVWTVSLSLKSTGSGQWAKYTAAHNTGGQDTDHEHQPVRIERDACANYVAFTLDGVVDLRAVQPGCDQRPDTQITGSFTQSSATQLPTS